MGDIWVAQEGYFIRLKGRDYRAYIDPTWPKDRPAFIYLEEEEEIPDFVFTFDPVNAGKDSGSVRLEDLETDKADHCYQFFVGVRFPGRVYFEYPLGEKAFSHDGVIWDIAVVKKRDIGYIDNEKSPFEDPRFPKKGLWIFKGVKIAALYWNGPDTNKTFTQQLNFRGKKFRWSLVKEAELLRKLEVKVIPYTPIQLGKIG